MEDAIVQTILRYVELGGEPALIALLIGALIWRDRQLSASYEKRIEESKAAILRIEQNTQAMTAVAQMNSERTRAIETLITVMAGVAETVKAAAGSTELTRTAVEENRVEIKLMKQQLGFSEFPDGRKIRRGG